MILPSKIKGLRIAYRVFVAIIWMLIAVVCPQAAIDEIKIGEKDNGRFSENQGK